MEQMTIGVIGGSGLYEIEGLTDIEEVSLETPFGTPIPVTHDLSEIASFFAVADGKAHQPNKA